MEAFVRENANRDRVSLPRFFSRVSDSISPLLATGADPRQFLSTKTVRIESPDDIELHQFHVAGFLLVVNLCARLYPQVRIVAPPRVAEQCRALALAINPNCDVVLGEGSGSPAGTIAWACPPRTPESIVVAPTGWEVVVDLPEATRVHSTNMLAALGAAAIAASELFRLVFAEYLPRGRTAASPGRFNVLTHSPTSAVLPDLPSDIRVGRVHLVGAGAVGQAAAYALARVSAVGTIVVVDPEAITLSNLQRYVLAMDVDVETSKCALIERAFSKTRKIETIAVESAWNIDHADLKSASVVCTAVDTEETRIAVQASLPHRVYNAWTQPTDIGWSRHEEFGTQPCLACLYWPTHARPSYHENIARAIRQHELRVLAYLTMRVPVDRALRKEQIPQIEQYPIPAEAANWIQQPLLDDIALQLEVSAEDVAIWKGRLLPELYREGICAGALVRKQTSEVPAEMAVPLAHQSVMAGVMLATQLLAAAHPELRAHRNSATEFRLDMLAGLPQITARPRQRTPGCLCDDPDFVEYHRTKWNVR